MSKALKKLPGFSWMAVVMLVIGFFIIAVFIFPCTRDKVEIASRIQSASNLKNIAGAMIEYREEHGSLPPAVSYFDPERKIPVSWRVLLLPYLGYEDLYRQYRLTETWDSPHNRKLLAKIPEVYRNPNESSSSTNASYFVFTGEKTYFPLEDIVMTTVQSSLTDSANKEKIIWVSNSKLIDSGSKTIVSVEARRDIPWTKPEDIPYAADKPLPELGGYHSGIFMAAYGDGSIHKVSRDINKKILRELISRPSLNIASP